MPYVLILIIMEWLYMINVLCPLRYMLSVLLTCVGVTYIKSTELLPKSNVTMETICNEASFALWYNTSLI